VWCVVMWIMTLSYHHAVSCSHLPNASLGRLVVALRSRRAVSELLASFSSAILRLLRRPFDIGSASACTILP